MKSVNSEHKRVIIHAGAVCDAQGVSLRPAVIHLQGNSIIKIESRSAVPDSSNEVSSDEYTLGGSDCQIIDLQKYLIMPALVNAHTHLDLSHIGPVSYAGNFLDWVEKVAEQRAFDDDGVGKAVELGLKLSMSGGSGIIGDISGCGSLVPAQVLTGSRDILSVSFIEYFGLGKFQQDTIEKMYFDAVVLERMACDQHYTGLQPHALYSAGTKVYDTAVELALKHNLGLSTHLSELIEEEMFTRTLSGPWVDFFKRIGKWDGASMRAEGKHPINLIQPFLNKFSRSSVRHSGWVTAHVNYADYSHLQIISESNTNVVYCPRASAYFGHKNHRYLEMMQCGINVALGTDSILCLDTSDRLSILDEMAFLYKRDEVDARILLKMATMNGAIALGFDKSLATLGEGEVAGLIAVEFDLNSTVDPLEQILLRENVVGGSGIVMVLQK